MEHWILDLKTAEDVIGVVVYGYSEVATNSRVICSRCDASPPGTS